VGGLKKWLEEKLRHSSRIRKTRRRRDRSGGVFPKDSLLLMLFRHFTGAVIRVGLATLST
ncbi:MAG: hypothetical protein WCA91_23185, partial [Candidatus Acidiferrales bacterium]